LNTRAVHFRKEARDGGEVRPPIGFQRIDAGESARFDARTKRIEEAPLGRFPRPLERIEAAESATE